MVPQDSVADPVPVKEKNGSPKLSQGHVQTIGTKKNVTLLILFRYFTVKPQKVTLRSPSSITK